MSNLGDKKIQDTWPGVIKTSDEGAIGSTPKRLQDGTGQNLPLDVTTTQTRFYGNVDFTNATVSGISGGGGSGTSGTSGTSGLTGASGTSGTSGTSGGGGGTPTYFANPGLFTLNGPSSADAIFASVLIPGGTVTAGARLTINFPVDHYASTGWIYSSGCFGVTSGDIDWSKAFLGQQYPGVTRNNWYRIWTVGSDGSTTYLQDHNTYDPSASGDPIQEYPINWANDVYVNFIAWVDNAGDYITIYSPNIKIDTV